MNHAESPVGPLPGFQWLEDCKDFLDTLRALESEPDLMARRQRAIEVTLAKFHSDFGFWSWGRGHPDSNELVTPIALIPVGLPQKQVDAFFQIGMSQDSDRWYRRPFLETLKKQTQACRARQHFWSDEVWAQSGLRSHVARETQLDEWMICVRYPTPQTWSCLVVLRKVGSPRFHDLDCVFLELATASLPWLQCGSTATQNNADLSGLSLRNAEVLHLLLDGRSRKEIAATLGVTTHIVNDCIKQIYNHFGTTSATELAAKFLRQL